MRIAFLGQANSIHFHRRTDWFARRGHQVLVLAHHWPDMPAYHPGVRLALCDFQAGRADPLATLAWLRRELEDFAPDVLHAHKLDYPGLFSLFLGFSPLAITLWDGILVRDPRLRPAARDLIPRAGELADLFTTNSPGLLAECVERGVSSAKTLLTSWGVDSTVYTPDGGDPQALRQRYGISPDETVLFSPRVLTNFSNLDVLVQSLEGAAKALPRFRLLMASYASTDDGLASFGRLLAGSPLRDRVVFAGRITGQAAMADHYRLADAVISLYSGYLESSPASIIEAMLCGAVPVVAAHPVIPFWVTDGVEGAVVSHRDPDSVARGVLRALDLVRADPGLLARNREKVLRQADYHRTMPMVEDQYARLAAARAPQFAAPGPDLAPAEQGLLLEALGHDQAALAAYQAASATGRRDQLLAWLERAGRHVDPKARAAFAAGAVNGLEPPASGDMRDYVWAAPLADDRDAAAAREWAERLARALQYDPEYLVALAALQPGADPAAVRSLLAAARPRNLLLAPVYAGLAREAAAAGDDGMREFWQGLAEESWQAQDLRLAGELKGIANPTTNS